uniref:Lipoprotein n=1 Tax=Anguilla anguilla TaxID=7936 RepID=A0A0E9PZ96_ANGAN
MTHKTDAVYCVASLTLFSCSRPDETKQRRVRPL